MSIIEKILKIDLGLLTIQSKSRGLKLVKKKYDLFKNLNQEEIDMYWSLYRARFCQFDETKLRFYQFDKTKKHI